VPGISINQIMKKPPSENAKAVLKLKCTEARTRKIFVIYGIVRKISPTVCCDEKKCCYLEYFFKIHPSIKSKHYYT